MRLAKICPRPEIALMPLPLVENVHCAILFDAPLKCFILLILQTAAEKLLCNYKSHKGSEFISYSICCPFSSHFLSIYIFVRSKKFLSLDDYSGPHIILLDKCLLGYVCSLVIRICSHSISTPTTHILIIALLLQI